MSRNDSRFEENVFEAAQTQEQPQRTPQKQHSQQSDIMQFVVPTEFVDLPSKGKYYPDWHPLCGQETVEIKYMTAKEEDILTSEALINKGIVIDKLIESVLIDKRIKAESLTIGDKNAIMMASRITGFGPEYSLDLKCKSCSEKSNYTFDLSEIGIKEVDMASEKEISERNGFFVMTLPRTGFEIEMKILLGKDELEIYERRKKQGLSANRDDMGALTSLLYQIIHSVNGSTSRVAIMNFVKNLPVRDSRFIRDIYAKVVPDINMKREYVCDKCGTAQEVDLPVTVGFFWPKL